MVSWNILSSYRRRFLVGAFSPRLMMILGTLGMFSCTLSFVYFLGNHQWQWNATSPNAENHDPLPVASLSFGVEEIASCTSTPSYQQSSAMAAAQKQPLTPETGAFQLRGVTNIAQSQCEPGFVCERSPAHRNGICVPIGTRQINESCWASPSLCAHGLVCVLNLEFWDSSVIQAAKKLNRLAIHYDPHRQKANGMTHRSINSTLRGLSPHNSVATVDNDGGLRNAIAWSLVPLVSDMLLDHDAMTCWAQQLWSAASLSLDTFTEFAAKKIIFSSPVDADQDRSPLLTHDPLIHATCREPVTHNNNSRPNHLVLPDAFNNTGLQATPCLLQTKLLMSSGTVDSTRSCRPWDVVETTSMGQHKASKNQEIKTTPTTNTSSSDCGSDIMETPCVTDVQCPPLFTKAGTITRVCDRVKGVCTWPSAAACVKEFYEFQENWELMKLAKNESPKPASRDAVGNFVCCLRSLAEVIAGFSANFNDLLNTRTLITGSSSTIEALPTLSVPPSLAMCGGREYDSEGWWIYTQMMKPPPTGSEKYHSVADISTQDSLKRKNIMPGGRLAHEGFANDKDNVLQSLEQNLTLVVHFSPRPEEQLSLSEKLFRTLGAERPEHQIYSLIASSVSQAFHIPQTSVRGGMAFVTDLQGKKRRPRGEGATYLFHDDWNTLFGSSGFLILPLQIRHSTESLLRYPNHDAVAQKLFGLLGPSTDIAMRMKYLGVGTNSSLNRHKYWHDILEQCRLVGLLPGHNSEQIRLWLSSVQQDYHLLQTAAHFTTKPPIHPFQQTSLGLVSSDAKQLKAESSFSPPKTKSTTVDTTPSLPVTTSLDLAEEPREKDGSFLFTRHLEYLPPLVDHTTMGIRNVSKAWMKGPHLEPHYPVDVDSALEEVYGRGRAVVAFNATFLDAEQLDGDASKGLQGFWTRRRSLKENDAYWKPDRMQEELQYQALRVLSANAALNDTSPLTFLLDLASALRQAPAQVLHSHWFADNEIEVAEVVVVPEGLRATFHIWPRTSSLSLVDTMPSLHPYRPSHYSNELAKELVAVLRNVSSSIWAEQPLFDQLDAQKSSAEYRCTTREFRENTDTSDAAMCSEDDVRGQNVEKHMLIKVEFQVEKAPDQIHEEWFRALAMGFRWIFYGLEQEPAWPHFVQLLDLRRRTEPATTMAALLAVGVPEGVTPKDLLLVFRNWIAAAATHHKDAYQFLLYEMTPDRIDTLSDSPLPASKTRRKEDARDEDLAALFGDPSHMTVELTSLRTWLTDVEELVVSTSLCLSLDRREVVEVVLPHSLDYVLLHEPLENFHFTIREAISKSAQVQLDRIIIDQVQPVYWYVGNDPHPDLHSSMKEQRSSITVTVSILPRLGVQWDRLDVTNIPARLAARNLKRQLRSNPYVRMAKNEERHRLYIDPSQQPPFLFDLPEINSLVSVVENQDQIRSYELGDMSDQNPEVIKERLQKASNALPWRRISTNGSFLHDDDIITSPLYGVYKAPVYVPIIKRPVPWYQTHEARWLKYFQPTETSDFQQTRVIEEAQETGPAKRIEGISDSVLTLSPPHRKAPLLGILGQLLSQATTRPPASTNTKAPLMLPIEYPKSTIEMLPRTPKSGRPGDLLQNEPGHSEILSQRGERIPGVAQWAPKNQLQSFDVLPVETVIKTEKNDERIPSSYTAGPTVSLQSQSYIPSHCLQPMSQQSASVTLPASVIHTLHSISPQLANQLTKIIPTNLLGSFNGVGQSRGLPAVQGVLTSIRSRLARLGLLRESTQNSQCEEYYSRLSSVSSVIPIVAPSNTVEGLSDMQEDLPAPAFIAYGEPEMDLQQFTERRNINLPIEPGLMSEEETITKSNDDVESKAATARITAAPTSPESLTSTNMNIRTGFQIGTLGIKEGNQELLLKKSEKIWNHHKVTLPTAVLVEQNNKTLVSKDNVESYTTFTSHIPVSFPSTTTTTTTTTKTTTTTTTTKTKTTTTTVLSVINDATGNRTSLLDISLLEVSDTTVGSVAPLEMRKSRISSLGSPFRSKGSLVANNRYNRLPFPSVNATSGFPAKQPLIMTRSPTGIAVAKNRSQSISNEFTSAIQSLQLRNATFFSKQLALEKTTSNQVANVTSGSSLLLTPLMLNGSVPIEHQTSTQQEFVLVPMELGYTGPMISSDRFKDADDQVPSSSEGLANGPKLLKKRQEEEILALPDLKGQALEYEQKQSQDCSLDQRFCQPSKRMSLNGFQNQQQKTQAVQQGTPTEKLEKQKGEPETQVELSMTTMEQPETHMEPPETRTEQPEMQTGQSEKAEEQKGTLKEQEKKKEHKTQVHHSMMQVHHSETEKKQFEKGTEQPDVQMKQSEMKVEQSMMKGPHQKMVTERGAPVKEQKIKMKHLETQIEQSDSLKKQLKTFMKQLEPLMKKTDTVTKELPETLMKQPSETLIKELTETISKQLLETLMEQMSEMLVKQLPETLVNQLPKNLMKQPPETLTKELVEASMKHPSQTLMKQTLINKKPEMLIKKKPETLIKYLPETLMKQPSKMLTKQTPQTFTDQHLPEMLTNQLPETLIKESPETLMTGLLETLIEHPSQTSMKQARETLIEQLPVMVMKQPPEMLMNQVPKTLINQLQETLMKQPPDTLMKELLQTLIKLSSKTSVKQARDTLIQELPETLIKHPSEMLIKQPSETLMKQPPETLVMHQSKTLIKQPSKTSTKQTPQTFINQLRETLIEKPPETLMKELLETLMKHPSKTSVKQARETLIKELQETLIKHPPEILIKQPSETLMKQPPEALMMHQSKTLIKKPSKTLTKQTPQTFMNQLTETLTNQLPKTLIEKPPETLMKELLETLMKHPSKTSAQQTPQKFLDQLPETLANQVSETLLKESPKTLMTGLRETLIERLLVMLMKQPPEMLIKESPETLMKQPPEKVTQQLSETSMRRPGALAEQLETLIKELETIMAQRKPFIKGGDIQKEQQGTQLTKQELLIKQGKQKKLESEMPQEEIQIVLPDALMDEPEIVTKQHQTLEKKPKTFTDISNTRNPKPKMLMKQQKTQIKQEKTMREQSKTAMEQPLTIVKEQPLTVVTAKPSTVVAEQSKSRMKQQDIQIVEETRMDHREAEVNEKVNHELEEPGHHVITPPTFGSPLTSSTVPSFVKNVVQYTFLTTPNSTLGHDGEPDVNSELESQRSEQHGFFVTKTSVLDMPDRVAFSMSGQEFPNSEHVKDTKFETANSLSYSFSEETVEGTAPEWFQMPNTTTTSHPAPKTLPIQNSKGLLAKNDGLSKHGVTHGMPIVEAKEKVGLIDRKRSALSILWDCLSKIQNPQLSHVSSIFMEKILELPMETILKTLDDSPAFNVPPTLQAAIANAVLAQDVSDETLLESMKNFLLSSDINAAISF